MAAGLTIVVPAWNEEKRLTTTVEEIVAVAQNRLREFEVIVINDGSTDGTAAAGEALAARFPFVSIVHHQRNLGVGAAYSTGLALATFPYLTLVPGDHAFHISGLDRLFALVGRFDMIVSYRENPQARTPLRRLLSHLCTLAMRQVTGQPIRDAHSLYVFPVTQARQVRHNNGYGYHIETLSTLLRGAVPYTEIPVTLNPRPDSSSQVMRLGVLACLVATMGRQFFRFVLLRQQIRFASPKTTPKRQHPVAA